MTTTNGNHEPCKHEFEPLYSKHGTPRRFDTDLYWCRLCGTVHELQPLNDDTQETHVVRRWVPENSKPFVDGGVGI